MAVAGGGATAMVLTALVAILLIAPTILVRVARMLVVHQHRDDALLPHQYCKFT